MWNAKSTHEKYNFIMTYVEAERGRYERGNLQISWGSLPAPERGNVGIVEFYRRIFAEGAGITETSNFQYSSEGQCVANIKNIMDPANGGVASGGSAGWLRQCATRARMLAQERQDNAAVAEYDKILRYCDLLEKHSAVSAKLGSLGVVDRWRGRFRDSTLVPAEAEAQDFVHHRLPIFNQTKIAILSHGQKTPTDIGRGHFITYRDTNQANAQTVTVFATRQADGSYKVTHAWQGDYNRNITWNAARLAEAIDLDRTLIEGLESRDGQVNAQSLAQTLRRVNVAPVVAPGAAPVVAPGAAQAPAPAPTTVAAAPAAPAAGDMSIMGIQLPWITASLGLPVAPTAAFPATTVSRPNSQPALAA